MIEARVIAVLRQELDALAHSALRTPAQRDSFEYGKVVGMYAGLSKALDAVETALSDQDDIEERYVKKPRGYAL